MWRLKDIGVHNEILYVALGNSTGVNFPLENILVGGFYREECSWGGGGWGFPKENFPMVDFFGGKFTEGWVFLWGKFPRRKIYRGEFSGGEFS